jgi:Uma2 family endonuclease
MSTLPKPLLSPEEYLALERAAERKSEYYQGEMFAMSGGSFNHNRLSSQFIAILNQSLRETGCAVLTSDMRTAVPQSKLYTYPDVSVVCSPPDLTAEDTLLNPVLIAEVPSPSTEAYDRGLKLELYRLIPSLQDYILISQTHIHVECYSRQESGIWALTEATGRASELLIPSLGLRLPLAELYRGLDLPAEPSRTAPPEPRPV